MSSIQVRIVGYNQEIYTIMVSNISFKLVHPLKYVVSFCIAKCVIQFSM